MKAATLFSGIGAPETAMPHWRWAWSAEIEKFPSAVLAARHPQSVNLGDVTADDFCERARAIATPDVIVFGSPCQDWSVAGKRLGLDGHRGNLALVALGIVARLKPRWFVFENVPGLLSNWSGGPECPPGAGSEVEGIENGDFATFLGCVDELGYSGAWASLDAQYRGLAQRRDRLFFVGHSHDWRYPAAVLFEPESLCGHSAPSREARASVAGALGTVSPGGGWRTGADEAAAGQLVTGTLNANGKAAGSATQQDAECGMLVARPLLGKGNSSHDESQETYVAHSLRAEGFDASEDGTGRGVPLVAASLEATRGRRYNPTHETFLPVAFDTTQITSKENRCRPEPGDPCHPLPAHGHPPAIAFQPNDPGGHIREELSPTLRTVDGGGSYGSQTCVAFQCHGSNVGEMGALRAGNGNETGGVPFVADTAASLTARWSIAAPAGNNVGMVNPVIYPSGVRRLLPVECERLMGFPDGYTAITYRGKPAADGPRYKALGNSQPVPVMHWILSRIEKLEQSGVMKVAA